MKRKIKGILVIAIVNILLLSGMSIGASTIENDEELISKQPYEQNELTFMNWFLNFLDRILEPFPRLRNAFSFTSVNAGVSNSCLVDLPDVPVTMYAWERPASWPAFFKIQLSGVGGGYDVSDGTYEGWCIEYGTPIPNGVAHSVMLHSSYCPPALFDVPGWNEINYILNNKQGDRWDVQRAIWYFINFGPWDWDQPHGESPVVTQYTLDMIDDAEDNSDYIPGPGDTVAVICEPISSRIQYTFIEVPVPEPYEGLTPGFWRNKAVRDDLWPEPYTAKGPDATTLSEAGFDTSLSYVNDDTMLKALKYGGGRGLSGMARILLRAAVAALLNAKHLEVNYPLTYTEVIDDVNVALASGNLGAMEDLKDILDDYNNLGANEWW
jgi:hypothetical protein